MVTTTYGNDSSRGRNDEGGTIGTCLREDYLLRGVAVPHGHHTVELYYRPASVRFGLLITSLAAFGWCLIVFRSPGQAIR
jgi:hypothetical protein